MIKFEEIAEEIIFKYTPLNGVSWIINRFQAKRSINIGKTFYFEEKDLYEEIKPVEFTMLDEVSFSLRS